MPSGLHVSAAPAVLNAARLRALLLTALLDTPPEDEFDRLTALTARVSGAPVSLVALIDEDRSYFKSTYGVPEVPPGRSVPLSHSLCQHVVGTGAPVVIDDAQTHPLVNDNGGVTDFGVGAYLGVPVRAPSGHVLGSLCAIEMGARSWTADDQVSLSSLAASVEGEIALRAELAERRAAEALARADADALEAVVGVNAQLAAELDPDRLVQAVVEAGVATTGATLGAFFYQPPGRRPAGDPFQFAATGVPRSVLDSFAAFDHTLASAASFSSPVHSDDVRVDATMTWVEKLAVEGALDVRSLAGVPVTDAAGRQVGALLFGHPEPDVFGARARRGALAIADQAAIALQNARLHRALDESERRHRTVLAGLSDVVFQTDAAGCFAYLNQAWADLTGHPVETAIGRSVLDYVAGDVEALGARVAEATRRATPGDPSAGTLHVEIACADGSVRHVEVRGRATFDAYGMVNGSAGTIIDVTDTVRYHSEREAREAARRAADQACAEAERMARLQSSLLANMSHEIRTPLTAILGCAEVLAGEAPEDLRDLAVSIQSGGERLMATLGSVLDLAQIDAGQMTPRPRPVDVTGRLAAVLDAFAPLAGRKGVRLHGDLAGVPPAVLVDSGLLDRAVSNLVDNAVKFTDGGAVTVRARHDRGRLTVEVEDTGIGIAPGAQATLFDPFQQVSDGHARTHEGNGLGLAIVRRVAELLGGSVSVESVPGRGSRFCLSVAAPAAAR